MPVKHCNRCDSDKELSEFHKNRRNKDGLYSYCKECNKAYARADWHENNEARLVKKRANAAKHRVSLSRKQSERQARYKLEVMTHYCDGKPYCKGCGVENMEVLTIDHVNEDGAAHRKVIAHNSLYSWLIRNEFPDGYQVLCWNCNNAKHRHQSVPVYTYREGFTPSVQYPKEQE